MYEKNELKWCLGWSLVKCALNEGKTLSVIKKPFAKTHCEFMPKKFLPKNFSSEHLLTFSTLKTPHHQKAKSDEN